MNVYRKSQLTSYPASIQVAIAKEWEQGAEFLAGGRYVDNNGEHVAVAVFRRGENFSLLQQIGRKGAQAVKLSGMMLADMAELVEC